VEWVLSHWHFLTGASGIVASVRLFPRFWRGLAKALAAPLILAIKEEQLKAREQQVLDLVELLEERSRRAGEDLPQTGKNAEARPPSND
jgi:hypothetical protein